MTDWVEIEFNAKVRKMNDNTHLYKRLDKIGNAMEHYLEAIPTDLTFEEMVESEYLSFYNLYEEAKEIYHVIQSELTRGRSLNSIEFTY